ncbi:MAG: type II secretion system protein GspG [Acidobacteria bacterium]|nr:MAG: type II secretion system protein GspG [Acidobacteriota bacterium]
MAKNRGFSLIELIVVLVVLGLLAGVVGIKVTRWGVEGKIRTTKLQISQFKPALETFRLDVGRYPTSSEGLSALVENAGIEGWGGPYLDDNLPKDAWKRPYNYRFPGEHREYDIWSYGGDGAQGGEGENADITSWGE